MHVKQRGFNDIFMSSMWVLMICMSSVGGLTICLNCVKLNEEGIFSTTIQTCSAIYWSLDDLLKFIGRIVLHLPKKIYNTALSLEPYFVCYIIHNNNEKKRTAP